MTLNPKIKLLAELADDYADNCIQMPGEYHPDWHTVRDLMFAELIIRECTKKCDAISSFTHNKNPKAYEASTSIKHNILEHFGIEE